MKKILMGFLAVLFVAAGLPKIADLLDASMKENAVESERSIAGNMGTDPQTKSPSKS